MAGRGVIFMDGKGSRENEKSIRKMVQDAGREKDFLFFSLGSPERSSTYNLLQYGDASQLKDKIMAVIEWSEPYYKGLCRRVLQNIFMELERSGQRLTLPEFSAKIKDKPENITALGELSKKDYEDASRIRDEIEALVNTRFGKLLDVQKGEIDLLDAYKNRKIVYFALDTQSYQDTAACLGG